ncbi:MAG: exodeoxyribonuclease VII large subunit [Planctomycetes bacterium]|nr:exodeoxyribonuclease VII large subunit [Planctomycetota bacterium]MBI3847479.1 exodeoxyribonuclease VII large subunit [Planctomycetota bacterium]
MTRAERPSPASPDAMPRVFSVSELTREIKALLEESFSSVWVSGEISNLHRHSSGHTYLTLKDSGSQIRGVIWRTSSARVRFRPEDGMEVIVQGRLAVYEPRGEYQLVIGTMEPKGFGAQQLALEQLKRKLQSEGLFESARKRSLPFLPRKIAIVTSPTGAALRDVLRVLFRRLPNARVSVVPARVQGEGAAIEVSRGIAVANDISDIDVVIVARGGGSSEDLSAFNEEIVVRAIAGSRVPVISAVGHEVDVTLSDLVSDRRAQTPTEAAEIVVPDRAVLAQTLEDRTRALLAAVRNGLDRRRSSLDAIARSQALRSPVDRIRAQQQALDEWSARLMSTMRLRLQRLLEATRVVAARIESMSPLRVLERGFSLTLKDGRIVRQASELRAGDCVRTLLMTGTFVATVTEVDVDAAHGGVGNRQRGET